MVTYSLDLPFFIPLSEGEYILRIDAYQFRIQHVVVQREEFDPRIGDIKPGSFGFVRDPVGALRYSRLSADFAVDYLIALGEVWLGKTAAFFAPDDPRYRAQRQAGVALAVFNRFLEKYRVVTRHVDVHPLVPSDLALLTFDDGRNSGEMRLYGGAFTLPVAGLSDAYQRFLTAKLVDPAPNPGFELAAVDALRMIEDGQTLAATVTVIGALETALDVYFTWTWRHGSHRVHPLEASGQLQVDAQIRKLRRATIEDVLRAAGVHAKVRAYARATSMAETQLDDLLEGIELRNLMVHGSIRVFPDRAKPSVKNIAAFVLDDLAPKIAVDCPALPHTDLHFACQELLGDDYSPHLQAVIEDYGVRYGLDARLHNERRKDRQMTSERFGETLVMRVSINGFEPTQVNLFIAQALLFHFLDRRGDVARARPADDLDLYEPDRPFFTDVASYLTRTVWMAAINAKLRNLGFAKDISAQAPRDAETLRAVFHPAFREPQLSEFGRWTNYLNVAHVAADLESAERSLLLHHVRQVAPETANQATAALRALETVTFDDLMSVRDALVRVHDANACSLAGTVSIFDPVTQQRYGWGTRR